MAKRKNSTALFEVMAASRRKAEAGGFLAPPARQQPVAVAVGEPPARESVARSSHAPPPGPSRLKGLGTPPIVTAARNWVAAMLEKRPTAAAEPTEQDVAADPLDADDPTVGVTARSLTSRPAPRAAAAPAAPAATTDPLPEEPPAPATGDRPLTYTTVMPTYARSAAAAPRAGDHRGAPKGNKVAIDRDRQQVTVKVRFNTAIIGAFAVVVVLGLAYILGKRAGTQDAPTARGPSSRELKGGTVQPGVLDPQQRRTGGTRKPAAAASGDAALARDRVPPGATAGIQPSAGTAGPTVTSGPAPFEDAPVADGTARRHNGLNYCVVESYKPDQQEIALEVRDYLNANGVSCTIEIGSAKTRTTSGNYVIVGTRGFVPGAYGGSPEYEHYKRTIGQVSDTFGQTGKLNRPQTMMVKWTD